MIVRERAVTREELLRALIKRAAVEVAQGKQPVAVCWYCGALVAISKARPHTPPMFCRAPAKCRWRADVVGARHGFTTSTAWVMAGAPGAPARAPA